MWTTTITERCTASSGFWVTLMNRYVGSEVLSFTDCIFFHMLRMEEFASRAAGGSISVFSVVIRATPDRHQRSVINNVYSLDMTTQLIRQEQPSTVPVHPCTHTTNPHTAHLLESVHGTHARTRVLRPLLHWQATIRPTSKPDYLSHDQTCDTWKTYSFISSTVQVQDAG